MTAREIPLAIPIKASNLDGVINNFVSPAGGTYEAVVSGAAGLGYSLVVTRGADFDTEANNSFDNAQPLDGVNVALGAISAGAGALFTLDDNLTSPPFPIYQTDPLTGAFGPSIPAPATEENNPFGLNMAYDGTYLYYNDGAEFGTNIIYKLDPSTGAVVDQSTPPSSVPQLTGLAYLDGTLYGLTLFDSTLYEFDASTLAFKGTIALGVNDAFTGIAGDPDRDVLWAVAQGFPGTIYEFDPNTGALLNSALDNDQGLNEQDIAYVNNELFVSDTDGLESEGGTNVLDVYSAATLAFERSMPVAVTGFVSGLAGDGLGGQDTDWYSFQANAGDGLVIQTTTPGATSASGLQFPNDLAPKSSCLIPAETWSIPTWAEPPMAATPS